MLSSFQINSTLLFFAVLYPLISFQFKDVKSRKSKLIVTLLIVGLAFIVKFGYENSLQTPNFYSKLEINRYASVLDVRKAYKKISKQLHPDKNTAPDADEQFQAIKKAYDVLMDEGQRDVYNRFGENFLEFDPRNDELKLLSDIAVVYIGWGVLSYIFTLSPGAKSCRTWIAIVAMIMLFMEVTFRLTETTLPSFLPAHMTENEVISYFHLLFPAIVAALRCFSEAYYVDLDLASIEILKRIAETHKAMNSVLFQMQSFIEHKDESVASAEQLSSKITELRDVIQTTHSSTQETILELKSSSTSFGSNYYWIIFVLIYGGVYLFQ